MLTPFHPSPLSPFHLEMKASRTGKYVSLTCTITAVSQAQLDDLYREISGNPMVAMAL